MARRACLAIGVSTVAPPAGRPQLFAYLDGAGIAARSIAEWARRSGFGDANVRVVTDDREDGAPNPVTRERVQRAVDELFPDGADNVVHFVLAFCGHGLTDSSFGQISWLFTDSLQQKYRVKSEGFFGELQLHGIERITLIADACREAPKDEDLLRLDAVRGVVVQGARLESPKFDRLAACQDGKQGYMVIDKTSAEPGKCVFTGVVADVLWGLEASALDNGVITTATFGTCVRSRTAERARDYDLNLNPQILVDPEAAILYDASHPPQGPPVLQPWPAPGALAMVQPAGAALAAPEENIVAANTDPVFRERILGRNFSTERHGVGSTEFLTVPSSSKDVLQDLVILREVPQSAPNRRVRDARIANAVTQLERDVAASARGRTATGVRRSLSQLKPSESPGASNLIISGTRAKIWAREPVQRGRRTSSRQGWRVAVDARGRPLLAEFSDGSFTPVVVYRDLYALVRRTPTGDVFHAYGSQWGPPMLESALTIIADFAAGRLNAADVDKFAAVLRAGKHGDPVLGAICAYLYRAVADYDSIRRMAYFYVLARQPIPFDVVLLADVIVEQTDRAGLMAHIPAVRRRERGPKDKDLPNYVTRATREISGAVGGRCPWLGLGWDYVQLARGEAAPLVADISEFSGSVPRNAFTLLPPDAGRELARKWELERQ